MPKKKKQNNTAMADTITTDTVTETPGWLLTSYGGSPGRARSGLDESPEEMRSKAYLAMKKGNVDQYLVYESDKMAAAITAVDPKSPAIAFFNNLSKSFSSRQSIPPDLPSISSISTSFYTSEQDNYSSVSKQPTPLDTTSKKTDSLLQLSYWIVGDDVTSVTQVEIDKTSLVFRLKERIYNTYKDTFKHIYPKDLRLWKVSIPLERCSEFPKASLEPSNILPPTSLAKIFLDLPNPDHLHFIVGLPDQSVEESRLPLTVVEEQEDIVTKLQKRFERIKITHQSEKSEVEANSPVFFRNFQTKEGIYNGLYSTVSPVDTTAPPIQLYNPVFAYFQDELTEREVGILPDMLEQTAVFMKVASGIYENEGESSDAFLPLLRDLLSSNLSSVANPDDSSTAAAVAVQINDAQEDIIVLLYENKSSMGKGGSDHSIQAALSMAQFWFQENRKDILSNTCCPTFLLVQAGPWIVVLGAIITDKVVVQPLTDFIWIGVHTLMNEAHFYFVARVFLALRNGIRRLKEFYVNVKSVEVPSSELHPRYFPSICEYKVDGKAIKFRYIKPFRDNANCVTFLAEAENSQKIVVKFAERYNETAHQLLAEKDFAPSLYHCGRVGANEEDPTYGHLRLIVMSYVDGETGTEAKEHSRLPSTFEASIAQALEYLHVEGFVFGDVRGKNIMITTNENKVKLVNFEWTGLSGRDLYPLWLPQSNDFPVGMRGSSIMEASHDKDMLKRLLLN